MALRTRALSRALLLALLPGALPVSASAGADLFWYDSNVGADPRIQRCDVASCTPTDFATSLEQLPGGDLGIDPLEGMVYWAINTGTWKVQRKSLSGGAIEDIFALPSFMQGIAVDPVARHVYVATPGVATRIRRFSIDAPGIATTFVHFLDSGCASCSPQGLALDLVNGFLYWSDTANDKVARKALDLASAIQDVVTGTNVHSALALDVANDRVYFSQHTPNRISYALLSSPATVVDLVNPLPSQLFAGGLERDPSAGTLGELYVAQGEGEIRHCSLDAGCPTLTLLTSGMTNNRGLALLVTSQVPALGPGAAVCLFALLGVAALLVARTRRRDAGPRRYRLGVL